MKISVIIPLYNVADYIEGCLKSVFSQSFDDIEVILVDDCGQDNSLDIARRVMDECAGNISCRILSHSHNRGLSAARNTGLAEAKGDYVFFLDSDDQLLPNALERLLVAAEKNEADVVVGEYCTTGGDDSCLSHLCGNLVLTSQMEVLEAYIAQKFYVMAWNKLVRRDFLQRRGIVFVEGLVHEDNPWSFEIACKAAKVVLLKEVTYQYLIRANSLQTGKDYSRHYDAYMAILERLYALAEEVTPSDSLSRWLERQKALFYAQTLELGTSQQQQEMYALIHRLKPYEKFSKAGCHYLLPKGLGQKFYNHFHRYQFC